MRRRIMLNDEGGNYADGYEYVDLGLPSGTLWAKTNVGASTETGYGNYYQWGKGASTYWETRGQSNYAGTESTLNLSADTAYQSWGSKWRMPTSSQCYELVSNTTHQWTSIDGVKGGKFTSKSNTEQYIFIPAAGYYSDNSLLSRDSLAYVWSCTKSGSNIKNMYISNYVINGDSSADSKSYGESIRPVIRK